MIRLPRSVTLPGPPRAPSLEALAAHDAVLGKTLRRTFADILLAITQLQEQALSSAVTNANGDSIRFGRDGGLQFCRVSRLVLTQSDVQGVTGSWTFPQPFANTDYSVALTLRGNTDGTGAGSVHGASTPNRREILHPVYGNKGTGSIAIRVNQVLGMTDFETGDELYADGFAMGEW